MSTPTIREQLIAQGVDIKPVNETVDGKPITNNAGEKFDPPPMIPVSAEPTIVPETPKQADDGVLRVKTQRIQQRVEMEMEDGSVLEGYIIKMNGTQRAQWLNFQSKRTAIEGDMIRITDMTNFNETLLSMCMIQGKGRIDENGKSMEGRLFTVGEIQTWAGDAIFQLFDKAQQVNKLGQYAADDGKK